MRQRSWLLPVLSAECAVPVEADRLLGGAALAAIDGDQRARDALYAAFAPRLLPQVRRIAGRLRASGERAVELDDVAQEAYLVFVDVLLSWPGGDSFSAYLTRVFPFRLNDAARRMAPSPGRAPILAIVPRGDESADSHEWRLTLDPLITTLTARDRDLVVARIVGGESIAAIGLRTGISPRTLQRDWQRIVAQLRARIGDECR